MAAWPFTILRVVNWWNPRSKVCDLWLCGSWVCGSGILGLWSVTCDPESWVWVDMWVCGFGPDPGLWGGWMETLALALGVDG